MGFEVETIPLILLQFTMIHQYHLSLTLCMKLHDTLLACFYDPLPQLLFQVNDSI